MKCFGFDSRDCLQNSKPVNINQCFNSVAPLNSVSGFVQPNKPIKSVLSGLPMKWFC